MVENTNVEFIVDKIYEMKDVVFCKDLSASVLPKSCDWQGQNGRSERCGVGELWQSCQVGGSGGSNSVVVVGVLEVRLALI